MVFLLLASAILIALSCLILRFSYVARGSAKIDFILFEPTDIKLDLQATIWRRIGDVIRYALYLSDIAWTGSRNTISLLWRRIRPGKKFDRRFLHWSFHRELYRKRPFFPSFRNWRYQHKREGRETARLPGGAGPGYRPPVESVHLIGTMQLPKRAYVHDSCIVEIALAPELTFAGNQPAKLSLVGKWDGGEIVQAEIDTDTEHKRFEILLNGIGIDVTPIETQVYAGEYVRFSWGCAFPHSGMQTLVLRINLFFDDDSDGIIRGSHACRLIHRVKVVQIDHLTSRQVRIYAGIAATVGVISAVVTILKGIGLLAP